MSVEATVLMVVGCGPEDDKDVTIFIESQTLLALFHMMYDPSGNYYERNPILTYLQEATS